MVFMASILIAAVTYWNKYRLSSWKAQSAWGIRTCFSEETAHPDDYENFIEHVYVKANKMNNKVILRKQWMTIGEYRYFHSMRSKVPSNGTLLEISEQVLMFTIEKKAGGCPVKKSEGNGVTLSITCCDVHLERVIGWDWRMTVLYELWEEMKKYFKRPSFEGCCSCGEKIRAVTFAQGLYYWWALYFGKSACPNCLISRKAGLNTVYVDFVYQPFRKSWHYRNYCCSNRRNRRVALRETWRERSQFTATMKERDCWPGKKQKYFIESILWGYFRRYLCP